MESRASFRPVVVTERRDRDRSVKTQGRHVNIFQGEDAKNDVEIGAKIGAKIALSRRLAIVQIAGVAALALLVGFTTFWISRDYNTLSAADSKRMISGGLSSVKNSLRTITLDYSLWTDAYEAIRDRDAAWIWSIYRHRHSGNRHHQSDDRH
jgi:hypothetical protein